MLWWAIETSTANTGPGFGSEPEDDDAPKCSHWWDSSCPTHLTVNSASVESHHVWHIFTSDPLLSVSNVSLTLCPGCLITEQSITDSFASLFCDKEKHSLVRIFLFNFFLPSSEKHYVDEDLSAQMQKVSLKFQ